MAASVVLASGDYTGVRDFRPMRIWDAETGQVVTPLDERAGRSDDLQFSPNGRLVLSLCNDSPPRAPVWDAATGKHLFSLTGHAGDIAAVKGIQGLKGLPF